MNVEPHAVVGPSYDGDTAGWAEHQAALLRAGRFAQLDIENIRAVVAAHGRIRSRPKGRRSRVT